MRPQDCDIIEALSTHINRALSYMSLFAQFILLECGLKVVRFMGGVLSVQIGPPPLLAYIVAAIGRFFCV